VKAANRCDQGRGGEPRQALVSVVVPAYNAEAFLAESLESAAAQTHRTLEIIIVDDGSTDRTAEVAEAFCAREGRARLLRQANKGVAAARNLGVAYAKGEWIAPLDHDDIWNSAKIERQVAAGEAAERGGARPGFVYCWFRRIDGEGRIIGSGLPYEVNGRAVDPLAYFNFVGTGSCLLIDAGALSGTSGFEESLHDSGAMGCDDILIQLELARDRGIACVPEYLTGYRVTPGSMSRDHERLRRSWLAMRAIFRRDGDAASARAWRWGEARRDLAVAEGRWFHGSKRSAAAALAKAVLRDPVRVGLAIGYRLARTMRRLAKPGREHDHPMFPDADTMGYLAGDRHEIGPLARLLLAHDAWRLRRLGAVIRPGGRGGERAMRGRKAFLPLPERDRAEGGWRGSAVGEDDAGRPN
jgi:glycosyltransferase involved in cell wall biosynthesis